MWFSLEDVAYRVLPRVRAGRALAPSEWLTLVQCAEVLVDRAPHGITAEEIADNVERFLIAGRSRRAWRVRVLLTCVELTPLASHRRPFRWLTKGERREVVEQQWIPGRRLGRLCAKVKNLVVLGAYGDPRAAARTGYVPVARRQRFVASAPSSTLTSIDA
jgi:hypothetical protein